MSELTHNHLLRYMTLKRNHLIGAVWIFDSSCYLNYLNPRGNKDGERISLDDFALLLDALDGGRIQPKSVRAKDLYERFAINHKTA